MNIKEWNQMIYEDGRGAANRMDRREHIRLTPIEPCPHFHCPNCPFEGDEEAMIEHALDCGHIALMVDEGCPLG